MVPELGCLGWTAGRLHAAARSEARRHGTRAAIEAAVAGYLRAGLVDRLDLSTSLLDEWTYQSWGVTQAQRAARPPGRASTRSAGTG